MARAHTALSPFRNHHFKPWDAGQHLPPVRVNPEITPFSHGRARIQQMTAVVAAFFAGLYARELADHSLAFHRGEVATLVPLDMLTSHEPRAPSRVGLLERRWFRSCLTRSVARLWDRGGRL